MKKRILSLVLIMVLLSVFPLNAMAIDLPQGAKATVDIGYVGDQSKNYVIPSGAYFQITSPQFQWQGYICVGVLYQGIGGMATASSVQNSKIDSEVITVTSATLLKKSPSSTSSTILTIPRNEKVSVIGSASGGYLQVIYKGYMGYMLHIYPKRTVRITWTHDTTFKQEYTSMNGSVPSHSYNIMRDAEKAFANKWNISFAYAGTKDIAGFARLCSLANNVDCHSRNVCGNVCTNDLSTPNHHKNLYRHHYAIRNEGLLSNSDFQVAFMGFKPCAVAGLGGGNLATVAVPNGLSYWNINYAKRTTQHEISHIYGCSDGKCTPGQACIMSGGFDGVTNYNQITIWCDNCTEVFNRTKY